MKILCFLFTCFFLLLHTPRLSAQDLAIDSLQNAISQQPDDTSKVNALNLLCKKLVEQEAYGVHTYAEQARGLAKKLNYPKGEAAACYTLARIEWQSGNFVVARASCAQAIELYTKLGDQKNLVRCYVLNGNFFAMMADEDKALESYKKAESIAEAAKEDALLENIYLSISDVYISQQNHSEGMRYCLKAKNQAVQKGDKSGEARVTVSIGFIWKRERNYEEALKSFTAAYGIYTEINDKYNLAATALYIGDVHNAQKNNAEALKWHLQAEKTAREINEATGTRNALQAIADDYEAQGNAAQSLYYFKMYHAVNDSIARSDFSATIAGLEMQYDRQRKTSELQKLKEENDGVPAPAGNNLIYILIAIIIFEFVGALIFILITQQRITKLKQEIQSMQHSQFTNPPGRNY